MAKPALRALLLILQGVASARLLRRPAQHVEAPEQANADAAPKLRGLGGKKGWSPNAALQQWKALGRVKQPLRCATSKCEAFGGPCKSNLECVTDRCYEGKCGYGPSCRAVHETCYQYAAHVCCSGECQPIALQNDCIKMLGVPMDVSKRPPGRNMDRECEFVGTCKPWPGQKVGPGPQSTPWAVPPDDFANKYYDLKGVTFSPDAAPDLDLFIARKTGQVYKNIPADAAKPGSMRDAGVVYFDADSATDPKMYGTYVEGIVTYCIAPILKAGVGGGFYAIGKDCCKKEDGFTCGVGGAPADVKSGVVIAQQMEKYANALQVLENTHGKKFHGDTFGVVTLLPIYLHMAADPDMQLNAPPLDMVYVAPLPTTYCVAPIMHADKKRVDEVNFWVVGLNCCGTDIGFKCGDVDNPDAHSGITDNDATGDFRLAISMAEVKYGVKSLVRPMYFHWTKEVLVPDPRAL